MDTILSSTEPIQSDSKPTSESAPLKDGSGIKVLRARTIRKPAAELYAFWRKFENLSRVIRHPTVITTLSPTDSRWVVTGPGGHPFEWTARIINEIPGELIAWKTLEGADIINAGTIRFEAAPGDEGTEVTVALAYDPPGGKLAAWFSKLTGAEPAQQVTDTLRRFKALLETGEIPTIEGQSVGEPQRSKNKENK